MASFLPLTIILFLQTQFMYNVHADDGILRFMALGDWGGLPMSQFNYSTAIERGVADGMGRLASDKPQDFVVALGDNFYFTGVDDVNDDRFYETFEKVFDDTSLQIPWLVCAGNHDHYGNVSAEIAYSDISDRWNFPSHYHTTTWAIQGTSSTVQIVLIDTIILCGNLGSDDSVDPPSGPLSKARAALHMEWIRKVTSSSTAQYLLVGGHYPVYSAGSHGNTQCLIDKLKPILDEYEVTAFLAGHDHNNQHLVVDGLNYFVTGCATFASYCPSHKDDVPKDSLKFFWADSKKLGGYMAFEVNESEMVATFMSGTGEQTHIVAIKPRTLNTMN